MDDEQTQIAVACDQCKENKNCLHLCCPFGKSYSLDYNENFDPKNPEPNCQEHGFDFIVDEIFQNLTRYSIYSNLIFVGPSKKSVTDNNEYIFECPEGTKLDVDTPIHFDIDAGGSLWNLDSANYYCLAIEDGNVSFETCKIDEFNLCEYVRDITFRVGYIMSAVSILITIKIKYADGSIMNKETSHGKVEFIYLLNILCFYGLLILSKFNRFKPLSLGCELYAYCVQYFKLSVFFSINFLAYSLYRIVVPRPDSNSDGNKRISKSLTRVSNLLHKLPEPDRKPFIYLGSVYTQGFPLLICLITLGVDFYRKSFLTTEDDKTSFPQAGVEKNCLFFYSNPEPLNRKSYILTPEFIYIQSFQLIIIIFNIFLLVIITNSYIQRQIRLRELQQRDLDKKRKYVIYIKWFVYTVSFWIFEIITSAIVAVYGIQNTCTPRNVAL